MKKNHIILFLIIVIACQYYIHDQFAGLNRTNPVEEDCFESLENGRERICPDTIEVKKSDPIDDNSILK